MLCLIRHGETVANAARLYAGHAEYELTQNGRLQAARIGEFVTSKIEGGFMVDRHIITSPILRAYETAEIIAGYLPDANIAIDDRIKEFDYGRLDGMPIKKGLSFIEEAHQVKGGRFGVETVSHVDRRAREFILDNQEYLDANPDKIKLAIGHGAIWGVVTALAESRPIRSAKIPKNYEVTLLSSGRAQIVDTRV